MQLSAEILREFLKTVVAETNAKRVHVIAHSMGNYDSTNRDRCLR